MFFLFGIVLLLFVFIGVVGMVIVFFIDGVVIVVVDVVVLVVLVVMGVCVMLLVVVLFRYFISLNDMFSFVLVLLGDCWKCCVSRLRLLMNRCGVLVFRVCSIVVIFGML